MSQPKGDSPDQPAYDLSSAELSARIHELEIELVACRADLATWQQRCQEIVRIVSHDLRGPLTLISGYTQSLLARMPDDGTDDRAALLATAQATYRLEKMIGQIVDHTRLDANLLDLRFNPVDLGLLLNDVVRKAGRRHNSRDIKLERPHHLPLVWSDQRRISQIIGSLISNAVNYSDESTPVLVSVTTADERLVLRVADHGVGITADEMPHLFEKYYRPERLRHLRREGLGLSLAIARAIADNLGASLWAESPGAERGATFYLSLPLTAPADLEDEE